jgi:hypothetical protein
LVLDDPSKGEEFASAQTGSVLLTSEFDQVRVFPSDPVAIA